PLRPDGGERQPGALRRTRLRHRPTTHDRPRLHARADVPARCRVPHVRALGRGWIRRLRRSGPRAGALLCHESDEDVDDQSRPARAGDRRRDVQGARLMGISLDEARAVYDRRRAAWLAEDLDAYVACFADDVVLETPG